MFGRRRRGFSRAASLARKRGRPLGRAPRQRKAAAAPKATSTMATSRQLSNSKTLTPPTGVMKNAKTAGGYTERWAKARGKK